MANGLNGVIPHLSIKERRCAEALEFYAKAFGAEEKSRHPATDGVRLMHAHMRVNAADVFLNDEFPEWTGETPPPAGVTLHLEVDDVDRWWKRALDAGCLVRMELGDQFWGARYGVLQDPFGHSWSMASPTKT